MSPTSIVQRRLACIALALTALASSPTALAQFTMTQSAPDSSFRTLTVTGVGEATAASTRGVLRIAFETEGESVQEALDKHEQEVLRVTELLRASGVPESEIYLDRSSVGQTDDSYPGRGSQDDGYVASRMVTVYLDNLPSIPRLMAEIIRNESDDLLTVHRRSVDVVYTLVDRAALREAALRNAVTDARRRASLIAEASDVRLGQIVTVSEQPLQSALLGGMDAAMIAEMGGGRSGAHRIESVVVVTFTIR